MPARPFGPPGDESKFDGWDECIAWAKDQGYSDEEAERICGAWKDETEGNAMTNTEPEYRQFYQSHPDEISLRELDDSEDDGMFAIRMPVASTGEVRNEGDEPLSREELDGMARQINTGDVGVFLSHGQSFEISDAQFGQTERLGSWADADLVDADDRDADDGATVMVADAVMADPETLPAATGRFRETLAILKEQAKRDIPLSSSIGWREDENSPGGNDLMEASIVGIPADPRTTSAQASDVAMARAAISAGADPGQYFDALRAAVMGPLDENEQGRRHLSTQQAEIADRLLTAYRNEQGNGSVRNFESWLWEVAWHQFDENEFHAAITALEEFYRETTPLEEPVTQDFAPFLDARQDDDQDSNDHDMSDSDTDPPDDESGTDDGRESDGMDEEEYRESMLEMQRQQTETLETLAEAIRADDDDDDEDDEDEDEDEQSADTESEQNADESEEERSIEVDGEQLTESEAEERIAEMRAQLADADAETPDEEEDDERDADRTAYNKYGLKPN